MSSHNTVALTPLCIGQFNLQFPRDGASHWMINFDWAEVERLPPRLHNRTEFWAHVHARRDALASQHHDSEPSLLYHYETVGDNAALLLHRGEDTNVSAYYLERYLWLGDRGYLFKGLGEGEEIKAKLPGYKRIFTRLHPIVQGERPGGFCIDGAVVETPIETISAMLISRPRGMPKTMLYVSTAEASTVRENVVDEDPRAFSANGRMAMDQEQFKLLRGDPLIRDEPASPTGFTILRTSARSVAGRSGDEAVWMKTMNNGVRKYRFLWLVNDGQPSLHGNPSLLLDMRSGDEMTPDANPVPEQDLVALWDAVLDSAEKR